MYSNKNNSQSSANFSPNKKFCQLIFNLDSKNNNFSSNTNSKNNLISGIKNTLLPEYDYYQEPKISLFIKIIDYDEIVKMI